MSDHTKLAKKAIKTYLVDNRILDIPENLPQEFYSQKAGVFVTINKGKNLKGCIGTFMPTKENIAKEIIINAIEAATNDYRFNPIKKEDLKDLNLEVSILNEPVKVKEVSELNPSKFGVIVMTGDGRTGLLLPGIEGIATVKDQIKFACMKGGIDPLKDKVEIYKFEVEKYN